MEKFSIRGGNKLRGTVAVSGAKNAALKSMAAALLASGQTLITNVPKIKDVETMADVLRFLGAEVVIGGDGSVSVDATGPLSWEAPFELVNQMRASIIVLGPLVARLGRARIAMPGGCNIGSRKIDQHLRGLEGMGAQIEVGHGFIEARARRLVGSVVTLDFPSVGATENLMMAASLAQGRTVIENAAREPEIIDLANLLKLMGGRVEGAGTRTVIVDGVTELGGANHRTIPDRIEAGTWLVASAMTRGEVVVKGANLKHLEAVVGKLKEAGVDVWTVNGGVAATCEKRPRPLNCPTLPYPGFPTDMQAPLMAFLSMTDGTSVITENVFENRFSVVGELNKLGAKIHMEGHHAVIRGARRLKGTQVTAPDLRAGAALVLAGLAAEGVTEVSGVSHIDRGYEIFERKLRNLGASVERVAEESPKGEEPILSQA